jgi:dolichol-phosphate mannosyltransferase
MTDSIQPVIYVMLPAYNEAPALGKLIPGIAGVLQQGYSVVVVDDGSDDGTDKLCDSLSGQYRIEYVRHEKNMGLGQAVATGLSHVVEKACGHDLLVIMDADNTHDPSLIKEMAETITDKDIVIASRFTGGGCQTGLGMFRKFLSLGAKFLSALFFHIRNVKDYTCGYRMYRIELIKAYIEEYGKLPATEKGFTVMAEMLLRLSKFGADCSEVPLVLRYDLKEGKSSMKVIRTVMQYFSLILRFIFGGNRIVRKKS